MSSKPVKMFCWENFFLVLLYLTHFKSPDVFVLLLFILSEQIFLKFLAGNSWINFCWSSGCLACLKISPLICQIFVFLRLGFFSFLLCSFLELRTSVLGTCSPAGNTPMTSVLLLSYLIIVNFYLKLVENPTGAQSVFTCKSVPQWHRYVWVCWRQLLVGGEGSWWTLYSEVGLPWKLTKSLCKSATYIKNIKLLARYKLCFPQEK